MSYIVITRSMDRVFVKSDGSGPRTWSCLDEAQMFATKRNGLVRWEDGRIPLRCICKRCESRCPECNGYHDTDVMCA